MVYQCHVWVDIGTEWNLELYISLFVIYTTYVDIGTEWNLENICRMLV